MILPISKSYLLDCIEETYKIKRGEKIPPLFYALSISSILERIRLNSDSRY
jgi:hypothetical protein